MLKNLPVFKVVTEKSYVKRKIYILHHLSAINKTCAKKQLRKISLIHLNHEAGTTAVRCILMESTVAKHAPISTYQHRLT